MKKIYAFVLAALLSVGSAMAQAEFTWNVSADVVSAYLWRGQYCGGLSLQPDVSIGYKSKHTSLSVGAWGNVGMSDWKFEKGTTYFVPELDLYFDFAFFGVHVGATHYYYFDGSPFLARFNNPTGTSQTEINFGYHFADELDFGLYIDGNVMILGDDGELIPSLSSTYFKRHFSTYIEVGYEVELPHDMTLTPALGFTPNLYSIYADQAWDSWANTGFTNLSLRFDKSWEVADHCSIGLFALGSINFNGINASNLWLNTAGDDKVGYQQKLNGCIGFNVSFE